MKKIIFACISFIFGTFLALLLLEIFFRFLPVNEGLGLQSVNAAQPVRKFQPNRNSVWSEGWNFTHVNTVHVNNDGFVNDQDYDAEKTSPLLAIIGDSYVEATMVPFKDTLQGRLAKEVRSSGRVYSFASSGSGLGTYLIYAKYVTEKYHPDGMAFVIIRNDFKEALYSYEKTPSFHYIKMDHGASPELIRVDYEPSFLRRILRQSRLAMYLMTNVGIQRALRVPFFLGKNDAIGHIPVNPEESDIDEKKLIEDGKNGIESFFELLPNMTELPPEKILFVMDSPRGELYDAKNILPSEDEYFDEMRNYFTEIAVKAGYKVTDLKIFFKQDYQYHQLRFEFLNDSHWNSEGHRVAAEAIQKSELFNKIFH